MTSIAIFNTVVSHKPMVALVKNNDFGLMEIIDKRSTIKKIKDVVVAVFKNGYTLIEKQRRCLHG